MDDLYFCIRNIIDIPKEISVPKKRFSRLKHALGRENPLRKSHTPSTDLPRVGEVFLYAYYNNTWHEKRAVNERKKHKR